MKKVILLTGAELRHEFFRKLISNNDKIHVLSSYCESQKGDLLEVVNKDVDANNLRLIHLSERAVVEDDFFGVYCKSVSDKSNPIFIERGQVNDEQIVENIIKLNPDIIVSYGCSIIKSKLLSSFSGKFINIHLGLSPYYRGSGTNFWPFVNNELQFLGTTYMHIDKGVDTGEVIHQIRPNINFNDNIHQIGNRLIKDSFFECIKLINFFDDLSTMTQIKLEKNKEKYFRKKDFTEQALKLAYYNMSKGIVKEYLKNKEIIDSKFKIIKNSGISS